MSLSQLKLSNLNEQRKQTQTQVSNAVSTLNAQTDIAMRQQAYMHKNPDSNGADELLVASTENFLATAAAFNEVASKLSDMQALQSGQMSIDDYLSKYSLDVADISNELI